MALNWDNISTTTRDHIVKPLKDNIFNSNVLLYRMLRKSTPATGKKILEPLIYAKGVSDFYSEYDTFTIQPKEKLTNAEFEWKQAYASLVISGLEEDVKNVGPEQIFSLIKTEAKIAEMTIKDMFSTNFFSTSAAGSDEIGNLYDYIINTTGTVGGIDASTYTWWKSKSIDASTSFGNSATPKYSELIDGTNSDAIDNVLRGLWKEVADGDEHPSLLVTTQVIYDAYESRLSQAKRYTGAVDQGLADAGFMNLGFRGVPMVVDKNCPDGYLFALNEKYIGFRHGAKRNFKFEPFQKPVNQDVRVAKILWAGNVTVSNRRFQGVVKNLPSDYTQAA